ncbi:MAG: type IX secretion system sortase PorU [Bacteroidaceae bacterium]|nr:type IX secretion system sortase PorU [Bacteroidaceae bacterium]
MSLRNAIFFLLFLFASLRLGAQNQVDFRISAHDYELVDDLPSYCIELPLATHASSRYEVSVLYPEYTALEADEQAHAESLKRLGKTDLELSQSTFINRKQPYLRVWFSPIVRHNGRWMRLAAGKIVARPLDAFAQSRATSTTTERWQRNSVLSSGKWAKIRVSSEGIYALKPDQLKQMGFSAPERVKVYGYGGRLQQEKFEFSTHNGINWNGDTPDDLIEQPTLQRGQEILFWAEGTTRWEYNERTQRWSHTKNHYSDHSYYFLTEGDNPLRISTLPASTLASQTLTQVPYGIALDDDKANWYEGGRRIFDSYDFANGNKKSFRLQLPDFAASDEGQSVNFEVVMGASSQTSVTQADVSLNGTKVQSLYMTRYSPLIEIARLATGYFSSTISAPDLTFDITTTAGNSARLDYIRASYQRQLSVVAQPYSFTPATASAVNLAFNNATATTRLWQIGGAGRATAEIPQQQSATGEIRFAIGDPTLRFVAFDANATFPQPEMVGQVETQNLHADANIDYVIIIPANGKLERQAERLADIHRNRSGMKVKVVKANALYNEFSSGTPDANAYRRYLKMLYDRAQTADQAPKYLLFLGKSPWDNRLVTNDWKGRSQDEFLLAYEVDASTQSVGTVNSFVSDDFFGVLDDGEGYMLRLDKMDLATGRMVCNTEAEATRLIDKVERYLSNRDAGPWKNTIVMLGDDGDANEHMNDAERVASDIDMVAGNRHTIQKVYWDRYTRQSGATGHTYPIVTDRVHQLMKQGALMFNYSGHGAPHQISHEKSLKMEDFQTSLSPTLPLWVLASCEIFPFDAKEENLAEASLFLPEGGAIAFMCATRAVYATQNNALNRQFCQQLFTLDANGQRNTMAEALRVAKVNMVTRRLDESINKLKYVYFGDPALALAIPTGGVVIDSIDGKAVVANRRTQLKAGQVVRFSGYVTQDQDQTAAANDFNGTITTEIFDRAETIVCKDNDGSASRAGVSPLKFTEQVRSIFRGTNAVKNGRFELTITIPRDISYTDDNARVSFYALRDDHQLECNGINESFYLNGTSELAAADTIPPTVLAYLNNVAAPTWAVVNSQPTFVAQISDDSGINTAGNSLGHDIELIIDGDNSNPIVLNDYFTYDFGSYQKGQVVYPLSGLSQGRHFLDFRVWDVNNNSTTTRLNFMVGSDNLQSTNVALTHNPASTNTTLIAYFKPASQGESRLTYEIYDNQGLKVWTATETIGAGIGAASRTFHLVSSAGAPLPSGVFLYRVVVDNADGQQTAKAQKLIIVRN